MSGTTGFMIGRRRVLDGQFDGVAGVTVSHQYFDTFYRAVLDQPTASAAGLVRTDGAVLVRFPTRSAIRSRSRHPTRSW
jgi:hypothetical protein